MGIVSSQVSSRAFLPPPSTYSESLPGLEWASVDSTENKVPYVGHMSPEAKFSILFSHGNAEDLGELQEWMKYVSSHVKVSINYEYQGYGINCPDLSPSEYACYDNIRTVYEHMIQNLSIPPSTIFLWGRSLGSGPTVHLASSLWNERKVRTQSFFACWTAPKTPYTTHMELPIAGVILQSPLTSAIRVVSKQLAFSSFDIFQNIKKIQEILSPILIVHGANDIVVPFDHGRELFEKAPNGFKFLQLATAGHNDIEINHTSTLLSAIEELFHHTIEKEEGTS